MKKSLFFTVFAILGLASCSKSEIEYDNQPQEISLFAVNKVATKAPVEGTIFPEGYKMMVAAYLAAGDGVPTGGRDYFTATQFSKNGSYWTGGKYWPISAATLNFLAVAPEVEDVVETTTPDSPFAAKSVTTVSGNEIWATQYDVMYATARASKNAATPPADVDMTFNHAYSWIEFTFRKSTSEPNITINNIKLYNVACNGTFTVNVNNYNSADNAYPLTVANHTWSGYSLTDIVVPTDGSTFTLSTSAQPYFNGILLIPSQMNKFVINYTINDQTFDYTYIPATSDWTAGTKYIYNITMTPSLIQVDPTVTTWDNNETNMELDTPTP